MQDFISRISELISKHLNGSITNVEQQELDAWLDESEDHKTLFNRVINKDFVAQELEKMDSYDASAAWQQFSKRYSPATIISNRFKYRSLFWAAAVLIVLITSALLFFSPSEQEKQITQKPSEAYDIKAPGAKARIILNNGNSLAIDSVRSGNMARENNASIVKTAEGNIVYNRADTEDNEATVYNTLENPAGSQVVHLTLSDGTKVWLNAASSLHYPVAFNGDNRTVEITGEAYFEVAKNAAKPFYVKTVNTVSKVLGTHFNINAYKDEPATEVTLLEGALLVSQQNGEGLLHPGQQAVVQNGVKIISSVDTAMVMAWKNGFFSFKGADINTIMRQVTRWYGIEVHYANNINEKFYGDISRQENVSKLLNMLQATGAVHFTINGNNIEVNK
ncbi:FecR family protein [Parafilimonas sp.]|uniref:FecR family protein n=1 Tax=Parafilimonas sp. TaxID=1969739 RepID=UPI0039E4F59D